LPVLILAVMATAAVMVSSRPSDLPTGAPAVSHSQNIGWHTLGSWSGSGSIQTESFLVEGSVVRIRWSTKNEAPTGGNFRLTYHSAVSGRQLAVVADQPGASKGEAYVPEEPRPAYMFVESDHVEWSFTVEEAHSGTLDD
jgi:hypothetical protein